MKCYLYSALASLLLVVPSFAAEHLALEYGCNNKATAKAAEDVVSYRVYLPLGMLANLALEKSVAKAEGTKAQCKDHATDKAALAIEKEIFFLITGVPFRLKVDKATCNPTSADATLTDKYAIGYDPKVKFGTMVVTHHLRLEFDKDGKISGGYEVRPNPKKPTPATEAQNELAGPVSDLSKEKWEVTRLECKGSR